jgi:hypothetical protein
VSTIEELFRRKSSGSGLETEITAVGIRRTDHATPLYPQKLPLCSPTSGGRSVGTVRSRIQATEFVLFSFCTPSARPVVRQRPKFATLGIVALKECCQHSHGAQTVS